MISKERLLQPDPPFWTKTSWLQLGYASWVNLSVLSIGLAFGFSAIAVPQLLDKDSKIVLTLREKAMVASVLTLFSPIGCLISGILMDRLGRKLVLILCHIPTAMGWYYTGFAQSATDIIIGRIITGVGIGMAMVAPRAYVTEITLPNMRGLLGAFPNLGIAFGIAISAGLGAILKWDVLCWICGTYSTCMIFANWFLPETPYYMLIKGNVSNTRNVLQRFRSTKFNVEAELMELSDFKAVNNIHKLSTVETVKALFSASSCKPFSITMFYIILMQAVGINVVLMWAVDMLLRSNSSIDANLGNFVLAITRITSAITMSFCLFKIGRRPLAMISAIGLGFTGILLGVFLHTHDEQTPYPLFFFIAYIGFASHGYYTLPFLMMFEMLPLQVRGVLSGIVLSTFNLAMCGMNQIYPTMRNKLGLANTFIVYGAISLIGSVVLYIILPETRGMTLQEIEEYYNDLRPTLMSERQLISLQRQQSEWSAHEDEINRKRHTSNDHKRKRQYDNETENGLSKLKKQEIRNARHRKATPEDKHESKDDKEQDVNAPNKSKAPEPLAIVIRDDSNDNQKSTD